ncbi:MAG: CYTH domain-containing protein [Deltaproteobacteria bacterium]|nr:MAG: CYTH domain-containing protein [Deltaproteobacteria bacterium]
MYGAEPDPGLTATVEKGKKDKGKVKGARFEIERKFLVADDRWRGQGDGVYTRQGYLSVDPDRTVRVRLIGKKGFLTVKGRSEGPVRPEFEYAIPGKQARYMLDHLCLRPQIEKVRYRIEFDGMAWEVDEFLGDNAGLVLAEVELDSPDRKVRCPEWVGPEVTGDHRYSNAWLSQHPWKTWDKGG